MKLTEEECWLYRMTSGRPKEPAGYMLLICQVSCMMCDCPNANLFGIIWPTIGLLWVFFRLCWEAKKNDSTFTEMLVTMSSVPGFLVKVFWWPMDMYYVFFTNGPYSTFRGEIKMLIHQDGPKYNDWARGPVTMPSYDEWHLGEAQRCLAEETERILGEAQSLKELPLAIKAEVQTTCACGATATVLAVCPTPKCAAADQQQSAVISSSGWVTAMGKSTSSPLINVTDVRLRTIVTGTSNVTVFADLDIQEAATSKPNWLKMAQLNITISDSDTLHVGRIPNAVTFNLPDPFVQETVSYPRVPYGFFGYGLQYERRTAELHLVANVMSLTSYNFTDSAQFKGAEIGARADHDFTDKFNVGVAFLVRQNTVTGSVDLNYRPTSYLTVKAMGYASTLAQNNGFNLTGILRPLHALPGFDVHSMVDVQTGDHSGGFLQRSVGLGLRTTDNRWSVTADWEAGRNAVKDSFAVRLIHQF